VPARRRPQAGTGTFVALVALGLLFVVAVALVAGAAGGLVLVAAAALAFIPLIGVLAAIRWVDRWEPEPWPALAVALGWGASVAVIVALLLNSGAMLVISVLSTAESATTAGAVLVAPVVEELIKGLGVLIVFAVWRRFFDGPVDGVVYAGMVAAGFAFVENILYFGETITASSGHVGASSAVATVFVLRALISPFAHVVFTVCTGLALGLASQRPGNTWMWAFPLGLAVAMVLHGLWNAAAVVAGGAGFLIGYVLVQVPVFGALVGLVVWLRRKEAAVLRARLAELVAMGRLSPAEMWMLTSLRHRRAARAWARGAGPTAATAMWALQMAATRWAFQRHRTLLGRQDLHGWHDELALLEDVALARRQLASGVPV
jgi:RsiW-degrading membrane proteinase PrsW (M82 family)